MHPKWEAPVTLCWLKGAKGPPWEAPLLPPSLNGVRWSHVCRTSNVPPCWWWCALSCAGVNSCLPIPVSYEISEACPALPWVVGVGRRGSRLLRTAMFPSGRVRCPKPILSSLFFLLPHPFHLSCPRMEELKEQSPRHIPLLHNPPDLIWVCKGSMLQRSFLCLKCSWGKKQLNPSC